MVSKIHTTPQVPYSGYVHRRFLASLEKRALQLGVAEHKESHMRIFWFGIFIGWITSSDFLTQICLLSGHFDTYL